MDYLKKNQHYPDSLREQVSKALALIEEAMGAKFAEPGNPLLVSVRSGARASMPGMMDTILNLGLNDVTVEGLAKATANPQFAYDSYRRFIQMFACVVKDLEPHLMEDALDELKKKRGFTESQQLSADDLKELVSTFKSIYKNELQEELPQDCHTQLWEAIGAVFNSWDCARAKKYRAIHKIPDDWGTAVNVCAMVYGNMGNTSGTGVCFTRDPSTGENTFYGEYLMNAQGEDVVAGIRTPKPLHELQAEMPEVYRQLEDVREKLERRYRDVQDIEFTVQQGKLYLLQTRNAKRTTQASLKIAIDMVTEGIITKEEGLARVNPADLDKILHPTLDPRAHKQIIAKGLPASPGACSGRVVFTAHEAESWAARGENVLLIRDETSPEDIGGMHASQGFLTARGGMTSHAAVVARQMGKPCVAGCSSLHINPATKTVRVGPHEIFEGDWITMDGATGEVMLGKVATKEAPMGEDFQTFLRWAAETKVMAVRANADTPKDARYARNFGAEGIGLCRTEHMFFDEHRLPVVRQMILSKTLSERRAALEKLLPYQRADFEEILLAMEGFPVTIRLLDPPLHEFLPQEENDLIQLSLQINLNIDELKSRLKNLHEANPMLGHRGCRLGISHPEIYEMQVRAIVLAAANLRKQGKNVFPEIMIPLVSMESELKWLRERLLVAVRNAFDECAMVPFSIPFGTMIEVPRAALTAEKIAIHADFFSFGTNDLTQTTYGFSRDDSAPFLRVYRSENIVAEDPFAVIDEHGVGQLISIAAKLGLSANPDLKLGICGEHGGEPASIRFFHNTGLSSVSCSPFRVPIALLGAAQAQILAPRERTSQRVMNEKIT